VHQVRRSRPPATADAAAAVRDGGRGPGDVAQAAHEAHAAGLCVVPPAQDGSKRPAVAWAAFQRRRPTPDELATWYAADRAGVGLVCGQVSGGLELLEFETADAYQRYRAAAADAGLGGLVERVEAGYLERTPGGGVHWLYRCPPVGRNTKLACRPTRADERRHPEDRIKTLIETRGERGYVVVAPSHGPVHPSGRPYQLVRGGFASIAIISPDERVELHRLARSFDELPAPAPPHPDRPAGAAAADTGDRPGDQFAARVSWAELLQPHGWTPVARRGEVTDWRRPGKARGISATTNHAGSGLLWVFSTSTVFQAERSYTKFGTYAVLEHGGDHAAAARALAARGFGNPQEDTPATTPDAGDPRRHGHTGDQAPSGHRPPAAAVTSEPAQALAVGVAAADGVPYPTDPPADEPAGLAPAGRRPRRRPLRVVPNPPAGGGPPSGGATGSGAGGGRPVIQANNRQLPAITADALAALEAANTPPMLFTRGRVLVRVVHDGHGAHAEALTKAALRGHLARAADWQHVDPGTGATVEVAPPPAVVDDIDALPGWPFPPLERVTPAPVFAHDGTLVVAPGYHQAAATYYAPPAPLELPPVPPAPTPADLAEARRLLLAELLGEFPFTGPAERAHALALLLLPFARALIDGPTPLHVIEAPTEGTGKGLLADAAMLVYQGRAADPMAEGRDDDEWRKRITARLLAAAEYVFIDNLRRPLDSGALAAALTAERWTDRLLGQSKDVTVPARAIWVVTGNNPELSSELVRRTVRVRLDRGVDRPYLVTGFRHHPLRDWTRAHRAALVRAACTLIQAWLAAGRPPGRHTLGSYEAWARVMGGILDVAGVDGFLANLDEVYATATAALDALRALAEVWWDTHGPTPVGVAALYQLVQTHELGLLDAARNDEHSRRTRLGRLLRDSRGRVVGHWRIERAGTRSGAVQWRLSPRYAPPGGEGGVPTSPTSRLPHHPSAQVNDHAGGVGEVDEVVPVPCAYAGAHTHTRVCAGAGNNLTTLTTLTGNAVTSADASEGSHAQATALPHHPHPPAADTLLVQRCPRCGDQTPIVAEAARRGVLGRCLTCQATRAVVVDAAGSPVPWPASDPTTPAEAPADPNDGQTANRQDLAGGSTSLWPEPDDPTRWAR
jgi:hypothetical protein